MRTFTRATTLAVTLLLAALLAPSVAGARSANFVAVPDPSIAGGAVRFNASTSQGLTIQIGCPSGIDWYDWDFNGDGVTDASGKEVTHVFRTPGTYNVKLTVGVWAQWCSTASTTKPQTVHPNPTNDNSSFTRSTPLSGPEQSETSAGDPDGTGSASFTVYPGAANVCFNITHSNIEPTQAGHIHLGARGANGPPVVNLYSSMGTNGSINDCFPADPATIDGLRNNPRGYYVQLHNEPYPLGVIRGQLGD